MKGHTASQLGIEAIAMPALHAMVGRVVMVRALDAWRDDDRYTLWLTPPTPMKITRVAAYGRWTTPEWFDPYLDVEPIGHDSRLDGYGSFFIYGPSYCIDGQVTNDAFELVPWARGLWLQFTRPTTTGKVKVTG